MKHIFLLLSLAIISSLAYSQESWTRIYSSGESEIEYFYKIGAQDSERQILIRHNWEYASSSSENGNVKKFDRRSNSWYLPVNSFLSTRCQHCIDPPMSWDECGGSEFFMLSPSDTNFALSFMSTLCAMCPDAHTFITWNGGANFSMSFGSLGVPPNGGDIDPENDSILYYGFSTDASGFEPAIYKSIDRGLNWQLMQVIPNLKYASNYWISSGPKNGFISVSPINTSIIFTNHRDYLMMSTNAGLSFAPTSLPALKELSFDAIGNRTFGISSDTLYISTDNGLSWNSLLTPVLFNTIEPVPGNHNELFAGSDNGLYRSTDAGQTWQLYNNTFSPSKKVVGICKDPDSGDTVLVSTSDAVYKVFNSGLTQQLSSSMELPGSFKLLQNYPNPFNPTTNIKFDVGKSAFVKLVVSDALGRDIQTLVQDKLNAGSYSLTFDGAALSSGVYFYRIEAGEYSETMRMILLK